MVREGDRASLHRRQGARRTERVVGAQSPWRQGEKRKIELKGGHQNASGKGGGSVRRRRPLRQHMARGPLRPPSQIAAGLCSQRIAAGDGVSCWRPVGHSKRRTVTSLDWQGWRIWGQDGTQSALAYWWIELGASGARQSRDAMHARPAEQLHAAVPLAARLRASS